MHTMTRLMILSAKLESAYDYEDLARAILEVGVELKAHLVANPPTNQADFEEWENDLAYIDQVMEKARTHLGISKL